MSALKITLLRPSVCPSDDSFLLYIKAQSVTYHEPSGPSVGRKLNLDAPIGALVYFTRHNGAVPLSWWQCRVAVGAWCRPAGRPPSRDRSGPSARSKTGMD